MFNDELLSGIIDSLTGLDGRVGELERKENPAEGGIGPFTYEVHVAISGGGDFTSVKDAADYVLLTAQASEYWTIVVHAGDYEEAAFELPANSSLVGVGNAFISGNSLTMTGTYITLAGNCTMRNITLTLNMDPTSADCWAVACAGYVVLENCYILVNKNGGVGSVQTIGVISTLTGDVNNCWLRLVTQEASYPGSRRVIQYTDPNTAQRSYLRDCTLGFNSTDAIATDVSITVYVEGHSLWIIDCTIQKRTSASAGFDIRAGSGGTAYTSGTFYVKTFGTVTNLDAAAGSGGVTSVTVAAASGNGVLSTSGSPITTSGTITISLFDQDAWTVLARHSGTTGPVSFQALQVSHVPNLPASKITSGTLGVSVGGTGLTSYAVGDLLYASGATTLSKLAGVATGNALISGGVGTAPSWGKIGLTTHVSGTLGIGNGGTGLGTIAADNILYASALDTFAAAPITAFGRSLIDDANAAAGRTTLELVAGGVGDIWVEKAGDTMTGALVINASLTVNTTTLSVSSVTSRVGVGTLNPQQLLDVRGIIYSLRYGSQGTIRCARANGSEGAATAVLSADIVGQISFDGTYDTSETFASGCDLLVVASGDWTTSSNLPTTLRIRVNAGGGLVERMRISTSVLIGKTSGLTGAGDLDVQGNTRLTGNVGFYNTTPVAKPTVTGSRGGNAALASLLTALAGQGLVTDSSTA